jgi:Fic family protein
MEQWSERSRQMFDFMDIPVEFRDEVPYRRSFVDEYETNVDSLLPASLADTLHDAAHWKNSSHNVDGSLSHMTDFMTEFCWSSSKLEGCRFTLAESGAFLQLHESLQAEAAERSEESLIVLNHKRALDLLVFDARPHRVSFGLLQRLQSRLMQELLPPDRCGRVRDIHVYVSGTAYQPGWIPAVLEEVLQQIPRKAALIRNPVEAAFFLWIHIPYLQAFADGNKRTGRLAANIPLLGGHCAPLSFGGVEASDYVVAMLGVYERNDVSVAVDLFEWLYRRSMQKYPWMLG